MHSPLLKPSSVASSTRGPEEGLLLRKFGSARGVREAAVEDLAAVPGMTLKLATKLKDYL